VKTAAQQKAENDARPDDEEEPGVAQEGRPPAKKKRADAGKSRPMPWTAAGYSTFKEWDAAGRKKKRGSQSPKPAARAKSKPAAKAKSKPAAKAKSKPAAKAKSKPAKARKLMPKKSAPKKGLSTGKLKSGKLNSSKLKSGSLSSTKYAYQLP